MERGVSKYTHSQVRSSLIHKYLRTLIHKYGLKSEDGLKRSMLDVT